MIEIIPITSRSQWLAARQRDITASVAAALLGCHPYTTAYELWAVKTGLIAPDDEQEPVITENSITLPPMARGIDLEANALRLLAKLRPDWTKPNFGTINYRAEIGDIFEDGKLYFRDSDARLGATPDAIRIDPTRAGHGIIQIKTTSDHAYRKGEWRDPDTGETTGPTWIAIQCLLEMELTGASWGCIAVMVLGAKIAMHVVDVPLHPGVIAKVRSATADFWQMIAEGRAPEPDYSRDGEAIKMLYRDDNGSAIDLSGDNRIAVVLGEREALKARESDGSAAERARKVLDAEILHKLGNATIGILGDGRTIRAPVIRRKGHVVGPSQFRSITIKEGKTQ